MKKHELITGPVFEYVEKGKQFIYMKHIAKEYFPKYMLNLKDVNFVLDMYLKMKDDNNPIIAQYKALRAFRNLIVTRYYNVPYNTIDDVI